MNVQGTFAHFASAAPSISTLKDLSNLSPSVRAHLVNVYQTLGLTVLSAAIGAYTHLLYHLGGVLSVIGSILIALAIFSETDIRRKYALLLGFGFLQGLSTGPLVEALLFIDPTIITTAFASATAIFVCFTVSAMFAERRSMLFLGAILSSALSMMGIIGLINLFVGNPAIAGAQLYLGLLLFCGFVLYDTQLMIEKANRGNRDYVRDAMELFLDFIQLFVRIAIILAKQNQSKKKRNEQ